MCLLQELSSNMPSLGLKTLEYLTGYRTMPQSAIIENSVYGKTKENEITESERRAQLLAEENG